MTEREEQEETLRGLGDREDEIDLPRLGGPLPLSSTLIKHLITKNKAEIKLEPFP